MAYSVQAPGPHGPGYRLAGSPVSCRQLEADAGTVASTGHQTVTNWADMYSESTKKTKPTTF